MRLIDEVVGYANANAAAARDANDQQTWAAHHRNCVRIRDEHAAEIERLQEAKRGALSVADERSKENVGLRAEIERLRAALTNAQEKLKIYWKERPSHEYSGGMEFGQLMRQIDEALGDEQTPEKAEKPLVSADGKLYCKRCDEYYTTTNRDYRCPYCQR